MKFTNQTSQLGEHPSVFTSINRYHQHRPQHSGDPRIVARGLLLGDTNRVSGELAEWDIMFHPGDHTPTSGDTVAHRVVHDSSAHPKQRASFIVLAEDTDFLDDIDHWRQRIAEQQARGTLSDISYSPTYDEERVTATSEPERIFNDPETRETWWRSRITHHRNVTITTRIKTLQDNNGTVTAQDVAISISDGTTPRFFSVPVAILEQVVTALDFARYDAEAVTLTLRSRREQ